MRYYCVLVLGLLVLASGASAQPPKVATPLSPEQLAKLKERDTLWADANSAAQSGQYADALSRGTKAIDLERELWGRDDPRVAASLETLAGFSLRAEKWSEARSARKEALRILTDAKPREDWNVLNARFALEDVDRLEKLSPADREALRKAQEKNDEGLRLAAAGNWKESLHAFEEAFTARSRLLGESHRDSLASQYGVGMAQRGAKNDPAAKATLTQSLERTRTLVGDVHPDTIRVLIGLAGLQELAGELEASERLFREALLSTGQVYGESAANLSGARNNLARVLARRGNVDQAEPLFREAFEPLKLQGGIAPALATAKILRDAWKHKHGETHRDYLQATHRVGGLQLVLGLPRDAEATLRPVWNAIHSDAAFPHELAARIANDLGVASYQLADYQGARDLFDRALKLRTGKLGDSHADTLQSLRNLGWAEERLGNITEGRKLLTLCFERLGQAVKNPAIERTSSADAITIGEPSPVYPHLRLLYGTRLFMSPFNPPPARDLAAWVSALDRLSLLQRHLKMPPSDYSQKAIANYESAFGPRSFEAMIVVANCGSVILNPERVPLPFGPTHPVTASIYARRAAANQRAVGAASTAAIADARTAAKIRRETLGENHPDALNADEIAALIQADAGDWGDVVSGAEKILAARRTVQGARHPDVSKTLALLGVAFYHRGEIARSRASLTEALAIRAEKVPLDNDETFSISSDLAVVARQQGDYVLARRLLEEAHAALLRSAGPKDFRTLIVGSNLAVVQLEMGDFAAATAYFRGILAGEYSPLEKDLARLNLAAIHRVQGDFKSARTLYEEAAAAMPSNAQVHNLLGATCRDMADFPAAEASLTRALVLRRSVPGDRPDVAFTLSSLALLHQAQGDYPKAIREFEEALGIYRRQVGAASRDTADVASRLGLAYLLSGDLPRAKVALQEALATKENWARDQLPGLSEADALRFISGLGELDPLLTVLAQTPDAKAEDAYAAVWSSKGMATRALISRRQAVEDTPEVRSAVAALRLARGRLATLLRARDGVQTTMRDMPASYDVPRTQMPQGENFEALLLRVNREKEAAERELIRVSDSYRRRSEQFVQTPAELAKILPEGTVVIDFVRTKRWTRKADGRFDPVPVEVYEAFVLKSRSGRLEIDRRDLGEARLIDQNVTQWRELYAAAGALSRGPRKIPSPSGGANAQPPDRFLREQIWDRLAPAIGDADTVIVIPDGLLTSLPFAALPGSKPNQYLIEEVGIVTLPYAQQLLSIFSRPSAMEGKTILIGGVAYGEKPRETPAPATHRGPAGSRGATWKNLPGTKREVEALANLHPMRLVQLGGIEADKSSVMKAVSDGRYVHIATHGFFADPSEGSVTTRRRTPGTETNEVIETLTGRNPLVLSGLVLAGVDSPGAAPGEGILTAEEIADLDLAGTELVVLSACETGLGRVAGGEGVFGLQRAFALAGARATIGSLWQVDDDATAALMVEFYRRMWNEKAPEGKLKALRAAQLGVLRGETFTPPGGQKGDRVSPYFWAAFQLSGDPR